MADVLNDKVMCSDQDDDNDTNDDVPPPTLYEWYNYFKRFMDFALA